MTKVLVETPLYCHFVHHKPTHCLATEPTTPQSAESVAELNKDGLHFATNILNAEVSCFLCGSDSTTQL